MTKPKIEDVLIAVFKFQVIQANKMPPLVEGAKWLKAHYAALESLQEDFRKFEISEYIDWTPKYEIKTDKKQTSSKTSINGGKPVSLLNLKILKKVANK